jgi:hypothetical protein
MVNAISSLRIHHAFRDKSPAAAEGAGRPGPVPHPLPNRREPAGTADPASRGCRPQARKRRTVRRETTPVTSEAITPIASTLA